LNPDYRPYHPKWHRERVPIFWWIRRWPYMKFIAREMTSVLVTYSMLMLLALVVAVDRGQASFAAFLDWLSHPVMVVVNVAVLLGVLFHTITWLNLAPMALVPKIGGRRVPPRLVLLGHYGAWVACTAIVAWALVAR
jgi:fumarate reductase subunit C